MTDARNADNVLVENRSSGKDPIVMGRINEGPKNKEYTSPEIQNELISIMPNIVIKYVAKETPKMFAVCADKTKDVSKKEQMALVLPYVYITSIYESFVDYTYGLFPFAIPSHSQDCNNRKMERKRLRSTMKHVI